MKRLIAIVLLVLIVLGSLIVYHGFNPKGEYKFESMTVKKGAMSMEYKAGDPILGNITINEDVVKLTVNGDHTFTLTSSLTDLGSASGTWERDWFTVIFNGDFSAKIEWKSLRIVFGDEESSEYTVLVLKKSK